MALLERECAEWDIELPDEIRDDLIDDIYAAEDRPFARHRPRVIIGPVIANVEVKRCLLRLTRRMPVEALQHLFTQEPPPCKTPITRPHLTALEAQAVRLAPLCFCPTPEQAGSSAGSDRFDLYCGISPFGDAKIKRDPLRTQAADIALRKAGLLS